MTCIDYFSRLKYHEPECTCGYLNPVTEWAGDGYVRIIAYECPQCKKRTPIEEIIRKIKDKICKIVSKHSQHCGCEPKYCKFVNELYALVEEEK